MADAKVGAQAEKGTWDDFSEEETNTSKQSDKPKTLYMDLSKPGKYTVRPVGPHIKCRKLFKPYKATLKDEDKDSDPAWKAGFFPSKRYAINVIDRADGKLKILEKGATVFKGFANYKAIFDKNPSDVKVGADFVINVVVPKKNGQPNKLKTEYTVTHLKETPLTAEEVSMIKEQKLWPLTEIFRPTPLEKRMEMWNALSDSEKIAPKREDKDEDSDSKPATKTEARVKTPEPVQEKMQDSPSDGNDLFDTDNKSEDPDSAELF